MQKPLVFISHITEEKEIAQALKKLVESTFLSMIDVFVSSDPTSIKMGKRWLDEITHALKNCAVEIILASPESMKRPWINFEGGCGWIREIPVIPLCHSGMIPSKLPAPLGSLQAATATKLAELKLIFPVLADAVGCTLPDIDFAPFISTVKEFESTSRKIEEVKALIPISEVNGLTAYELATLVEIAEIAGSPDESVAIRELAGRLEKTSHRRILTLLAIKMLCRKSLVETSTESDWNGNDCHMVRVTDEGWHWMETNQDRLTLAMPSDLDNTDRGEQSSYNAPF